MTSRLAHSTRCCQMPGGGTDVTAKSLGARFQSRSRAVQGGFVYASWTQEVSNGEQVWEKNLQNPALRKMKYSDESKAGE